MEYTKDTATECAGLLVRAYRKALSGYKLRMPLLRDTSNKAPSTYAELKAKARAGWLTVSHENCANTVYIDAYDNITFRQFHDYGHLLYQLDFSTDGEIELAVRQWRDIALCIPESHRAQCRALYYADTVAQTMYYAQHGEFPANQREFVYGVLGITQPKETL